MVFSNLTHERTSLALSPMGSQQITGIRGINPLLSRNFPFKILNTKQIPLDSCS